MWSFIQSCLANILANPINPHYQPLLTKPPPPTNDVAKSKKSTTIIIQEGQTKTSDIPMDISYYL